ncbi:2Fe-2S iron-sulfur cluster-binding protein [Streptomyces sp. WG-D5]
MKVTFTGLPDGDAVLEVAEKTSVMKAALALGVPGIVGECGGEMSCGTCHVFVRRGEFRAISDAELEILEAVDDMTDASRLGCQLMLRPSGGDVVVEVPGDSSA